MEKFRKLSPPQTEPLAERLGQRAFHRREPSRLRILTGLSPLCCLSFRALWQASCLPHLAVVRSSGRVWRAPSDLCAPAVPPPGPPAAALSLPRGRRPSEPPRARPRARPQRPPPLRASRPGPHSPPPTWTSSSGSDWSEPGRQRRGGGKGRAEVK